MAQPGGYSNVPTLDFGGPLFEPGYPGLLNHSGIPAVIDSKINEGAVAIDFGQGVARGATDNTCTAVTATTTADQLLGLTVRAVLNVANLQNEVLYLQRDTVPILKSGWIWVVVAADVVRGGKVGISTTAASLGQVGPAGTGYLELAGAVFDSSATAGKLALVHIIHP